MPDMLDERQFWIAVRSALLLFVDAIERRYKLGKHAPAMSVRAANSDTTTLT